MKAEMLVAQSCLALCSPPGFSVCGIPQATILEWWPHHLPHLTLSSPLPASISLFSMSVSPLLSGRFLMTGPPGSPVQELLTECLEGAGPDLSDGDKAVNETQSLGGT